MCDDSLSFTVIYSKFNIWKFNKKKFLDINMNIKVQFNLLFFIKTRLYNVLEVTTKTQSKIHLTMLVL